MTLLCLLCNLPPGTCVFSSQRKHTKNSWMFFCARFLRERISWHSLWWIDNVDRFFFFSRSATESHFPFWPQSESFTVICNGEIGVDISSQDSASFLSQNCTSAYVVNENRVSSVEVLFWEYRAKDKICSHFPAASRLKRRMQLRPDHRNNLALSSMVLPRFACTECTPGISFQRKA